MKHAVVVRFQRGQGATYETGVGITDQAGTQSLLGILDGNGKFVEPWNFTIVYILGCMQLPDDSYFERKLK